MECLPASRYGPSRSTLESPCCISSTLSYVAHTAGLSQEQCRCRLMPSMDLEMTQQQPWPDSEICYEATTGNGQGWRRGLTVADSAPSWCRRCPWRRLCTCGLCASRNQSPCQQPKNMRRRLLRFTQTDCMLYAMCTGNHAPCLLHILPTFRDTGAWFAGAWATAWEGDGVKSPSAAAVDGISSASESLWRFRVAAGDSVEKHAPLPLAAPPLAEPGGMRGSSAQAK